ncbi:MAG: hypothetical protein NVS3B1_10080 [Marmoricola sp.]
MHKWNPDLTVTAPEWLVEGARVQYSTFARGRVGRVGEYKKVPTVWIDFDSGETKALALEFGLEFLQPETEVEAKGAQKRRLWRR